MQLFDLQVLIDKYSRFWHAGTYEMDDKQRLTYFALAMGGEAGELQNFVKKQIRDNAEHRSDIALEIADVFTYLMLIANTLGLDIEQCWERKMSINSKRWGTPPGMNKDQEYGV